MSDTPETKEDAPRNPDLLSELDIPSELIEDIPEAQRDQLIQHVKRSLRVEHFSGPLPPPSLLSQYEHDVQRVIVDEAVENRIHRTTLESRGQLMFFLKEMVGQLFGFVLAIALIVGSVQSVLAGHRVEGLVGIGGTVSLVVGAFLYTDHKKRLDRKEQQALQDESGKHDTPDSAIESGQQSSMLTEGNDA